MWADGQMCELGTTKARYVLAVLLLNPGRLVLIEKIIDRVWGEAPPAKPPASVHVYIARLRAKIGDDQAILTRSGGYVLNVDPERIDLYRFRMLNERARVLAQQGNTAEALRLCNEAEALWRGEPLSGLSGEWITSVRTDLENEHRSAIKTRLGLELDAGHHTEVVSELYRMVDQYPYDEAFAEQLMIALYRCGRQGDALKTYHQARHRLGEQHGTDPWPSLHRAYERILHGDPKLAPPQTRRSAPSAPLTGNLPRDVADFTGRETELGHLHEVVESGPTAVTIEAIDGMPGIGKTALAVHVARTLADRYGDGQWYLSLGAHDPNRPPLDPAEGLAILLRNIGEDPARIPEGLEGRAALWRARLTNRRMLIVLDDAADADQVRPFLPGTPGCLVLITSRSRLAGLEGIRPLSLEVPAPHDAALLFRRIVGPDRDLAAPDVNTLVRLCGHLPLAVTIMATRLRHRPARAVGDLVARLSRVEDRLAEMHAGDISVNRTFELSYRELSRPRQRAFRRLSLHIGTDFTAEAAAAMVGCDLRTAEHSLEELIDRHLVLEPHSGRMRFHDLLREYARNRAQEEESAGERRRVIHRLLDYYVNTADQADRALYPHRRRTPVWVAHTPADPPHVSDPRPAAEWLRAEHHNLLACAYFAAEHGFPFHTVHLSLMLATHLERSALWTDAGKLHETARRLCQEAGDRHALARVDLELSLVACRTGRYQTAMRHALNSLNTFRNLGDRRGEADILDHLARVSWLSGHSHRALSYAEEALAIFRATGDRYGEGNALLHRGIALSYLGRTEEAETDFRRSLDIIHTSNDSGTMAMILNNLGDLQFDRGNHDKALALYRESLAALRAAGWRQNEGVALINVANVLRSRGSLSEALHMYREALSIHRQTGDLRHATEATTGIGKTYLLSNQTAEALSHFQKALTVAQEIGDPYEQIRALQGIGEWRLRNQEHELARTTYAEALAIAQEVDDPRLAAGCLQGLGEAVAGTQGREHAMPYWSSALALYERLGAPEAAVLRAYLDTLDWKG
ncbi:AfsR/SARP family transcriptional regulator [Spongiactinospora gelatinilytica]|nr:tetratricopeptide repeat protein [Spongiactinospora gelatinilytica]